MVEVRQPCHMDRPEGPPREGGKHLFAGRGVWGGQAGLREVSPPGLGGPPVKTPRPAHLFSPAHSRDHGPWLRPVPPPQRAVCGHTSGEPGKPVYVCPLCLTEYAGLHVAPDRPPEGDAIQTKRPKKGKRRLLPSPTPQGAGPWSFTLNCPLLSLHPLLCGPQISQRERKLEA